MSSLDTALNKLVFAAPRYALVILLVGASFVIGAAALRKLNFANASERFALCATFGLGLVSHLILLVGLAGGMTTRGITGILAVAVTAAGWLLYREKSAVVAAPRMSKGELLVTLLCALAGVCVFVWPLSQLPLYPPTDSDSTSYHLVVSKIWVRAQAITPTPFLRMPVGPNLAHTLFAALMVLKDDVAAQVLSLAVTSIVAVGLYGWGQRVRGPLTGCVAAALWVGSPAVLKMVDVPSYHAIASLFAFAGMYTLANFGTTRQAKWLFASATFIGFAQSTWSMSFYFMPMLLAVTVYFAIKQQRFQLLVVCALGLAIGWGPTLIRCAWYTHNPTFPLFTQLFGTGPWWSAADTAAIQWELHIYGLPRTIGNFFAVPYQLAVSPNKFQSDCSYSIGLFLLLPFAMIRAVKDRYARWLLVALGFYVICWFTVSQIMRYLLPITPVLCIVSAITVQSAVAWTCRARLWSTAVTMVLVLSLLIPGFAYGSRQLHVRGPLPLTGSQRATYILPHRPPIAALSIANAAPAPLYSLFGATSAYYYDGLFMGDWVGPARFTQVFEASKNGEMLYSVLHRLAARYFLVNWRTDQMPIIPYDEQFDQRFEQIFANSTVELYRLHDVPVDQTTPSPNLLRNSAFEEIENRWPSSWQHRGNPRVLPSESGAQPAPTAIEVSSDQYFYQRVEVVPGGQYELRFHAKGNGDAAKLKVQVDWLDSHNHECGKFRHVMPVVRNRRVYVGRMQAPATAEKADVLAVGNSAEVVAEDTFSFRQLPTSSDRERQNDDKR